MPITPTTAIDDQRANNGSEVNNGASVARQTTRTSHAVSVAEGFISKLMPCADVIDDRLPVVAGGVGMAHHPIPEIGILHVQKRIECRLSGFIGVGETLFQPPPEQAIEFAGTTSGTPAEAFEAGVFHSGNGIL